MRRLLVFVVVLLALLGVGLGLALSSTSPPATAHYGPPGARFVVGFETPPQLREWQEVEATNTLFKGLVPRFTLYVASLGASSYESVSTLVYAQPLSTTQVHWYLHSYLFGFTPTTWHGLPAAQRDDACREGDTPFTCPGRVAVLDVVDGGVIYELSATQVADSEVTRLFGSFSLGRGSR